MKPKPLLDLAAAFAESLAGGELDGLLDELGKKFARKAGVHKAAKP